MTPATPSPYGLSSLFGGFWQSWVLPQYGQTAIWLQRINVDMPGVTPTPEWDGKRGVATSFLAGSYGVGWQLNGRQGYLAPQTISCAKNDSSKIEQVVEQGLIIYQGPIVLYQPPPILRKGDVLVFADGRYVVGDDITPAQVMGATIISGAKLEERSTDDIIYRIPLT